MRYAVWLGLLVGASCSDGTGATASDATGGGDGTVDDSSGSDGGGGEGGVDAGPIVIPFTTKASCAASADLLPARDGLSIDSTVEVNGSYREPVGGPPIRGSSFFSATVAQPCEAGLWSGSAWTVSNLPGAGHCAAIRAVGDGMGALVMSATRPVAATSPVTGILSRRVGTSWTTIATINNVERTRFVIDVGAGGHGVVAWGLGQDVHVGLTAPGATAMTELPVIVTGRADGIIQATIDGAGNGFVVWRNGSLAPFVRAFRAGAWAGSDASLGDDYQIARMVMLPTGAAYLAGSTTGRTITFDAGTASVGPTEALTAAGNLIASPNGDLTIVGRRNTADVFEKVVIAARKLAGGSGWLAAVDLGSVGGSQGLEVPVVDAGSHVTVSRSFNGTVYHHRIASGATTWEAPITVGSGAGTSILVSTDIDVATQDPIVSWATGSKVVWSRCQ